MKMPINLNQWIKDNRDYLKPPVCNRIVYEDSDFIIMVVGGPNNRQDYHLNQTEEFFYQLEGQMILKIIEQEQFKEVKITAGEIFLLPANIPHSPQRHENSAGLVIEMKRPKDVLDGFQWYCPLCHHMLYEEFLHVGDIVSQLPPVFERFYQHHARCDECGHRMDDDAKN
jgi:3-hydroxyanthranilate 3,4-dioxygenase